MIIKKKLSIDSAHKLDLPYESKCNNIHGHRWEVTCEIEGHLVNGMVIDFNKLKSFFDKYDHVYLNDVYGSPTTVENLSGHFAVEIFKMQDNISRVKVSLRETENSFAISEYK